MKLYISTIAFLNEILVRDIKGSTHIKARKTPPTYIELRTTIPTREQMRLPRRWTPNLMKSEHWREANQCEHVNSSNVER